MGESTVDKGKPSGLVKSNIVRHRKTYRSLRRYYLYRKLLEYD